MVETTHWMLPVGFERLASVPALILQFLRARLSGRSTVASVQVPQKQSSAPFGLCYVETRQEVVLRVQWLPQISYASFSEAFWLGVNIPSVRDSMHHFCIWQPPTHHSARCDRVGR